MNIAVFDYGAGNLHSLVKALEAPGRVVRLDTDLRTALETDLLVLPGVGAFSAAAVRMAEARDEARDALRRGLPCLGICLGMQLLFGESDEGPGRGLQLINGRVTRLEALQVPQIGWNTIEAPGDPAFADSALRTAYYANSYVCRPVDVSCVVAWSTHESDRFAAAVRLGNTLGVQFHPEKSSAPGIAFIQRFLTDVTPG